MNKKGQGLPMNVVVIGLLAVVVLLLVVLMFFGGAKWVKETLFGISAERLKGTDITLAQQQCELYCDYAKDLETEAVKESALCKTTFRLDRDNDGEIDEKEYYCKEIGITCGNIC